MKGLKTPFNSLKTMLIRLVDNIRDVGGNERAIFFDQIIFDFEQDINT
jgi:hypothetical protein